MVFLKTILILGVFGENIEKLCSKLKQVPEEYQKNQMKRDNDVHHITVILKKEVPSLEKLSSIEDYAKIVSELQKKTSNEKTIFIELMSKVILADYQDLG